MSTVNPSDPRPGHDLPHLLGMWISTEMRPGGVVSTVVLRAHGYEHSEIRRGVNNGDLIRLRRGWFSFPHADPRVVRAVKAGGVLGCVSALSFHGVWTLNNGRIHVQRSNYGRRGPAKIAACPPIGTRAAPHVAVDPVHLALRSASACASAEEFVVLLDSVRHLGLMTLEDIRATMSDRPGSIQALIARSDRAESGTESMVRLRLRRRGIRIRAQVDIPGIGRVDFLVGQRLVIEVDSVAHHTGVSNYRSDRLRDLRLVAADYVVVRLTWEQVVLEWPRTEAYLLHMIRTKRHLAGRNLRLEMGPAA